MFKWGEKKRLRELHNARCRRYYQRHLSKQARERKEREELRKQRRKVIEPTITQKEVKKDTNIVDGWL